MSAAPASDTWPQIAVGASEKDTYHVTCDWGDGEPRADQWPRVTSVLELVPKPWLANWAAKMARDHALACYGETGNLEGALKAYGKGHPHDREAKRAARIGTDAHAAVVAECRGELTEIRSIEVAMAVQASSVWRSARDFEAVALETSVAHPFHRYAGTPDWLARVTDPNGKRILALGDWKTSAKLRKEFPLQIEAYRQASYYCEPLRSSGERIEAVVNVRLPKMAGEQLEERWYYIEDPILETAWRAFLAALDFYTLWHRLPG